MVSADDGGEQPFLDDPRVEPNGKRPASRVRTTAPKRPSSMRSRAANALADIRTVVGFNGSTNGEQRQAKGTNGSTAANGSTGANGTTATNGTNGTNGGHGSLVTADVPVISPPDIVEVDRGPSGPPTEIGPVEPVETIEPVETLSVDTDTAAPADVIETAPATTSDLVADEVVEAPTTPAAETPILEILARLPTMEPAPIPLQTPASGTPQPTSRHFLRPSVVETAGVAFLDYGTAGEQPPPPPMPNVVVPPSSTAQPKIIAPPRRRRPRVRRVTRVIRHVDPWSVFKVALCFSMVLYGVCLTAGVLLWNVAYTTGTIDNVQRFFESFGWNTFRFKGGQIYHNAWIAGLFAALGLTGLIVLAVTLFNLITDLVGGIRVTVLEEEVIEREPGMSRSLLRRRSRQYPQINAPAPGETSSIPMVAPTPIPTSPPMLPEEPINWG